MRVDLRRADKFVNTSQNWHTHEVFFDIGPTIMDPAIHYPIDIVLFNRTDQSYFAHK